jgi:hypothetical protein
MGGLGAPPGSKSDASLIDDNFGKHSCDVAPAPSKRGSMQPSLPAQFWTIFHNGHNRYRVLWFTWFIKFLLLCCPKAGRGSPCHRGIAGRCLPARRRGHTSQPIYSILQIAIHILQVDRTFWCHLNGKRTKFTAGNISEVDPA